MKKTIQIIVMAMLCLNFKAEAQENKAIDVTSKGIQIGQKVPDITITNLHNYKDASGKPATTAKLSDFKGKLLILDFWATWCSPCVAMIPKMDSMQKQFGDKIQFLSVTYQNEKEVLPFLAKFEKQKGEHYNLPVMSGDTSLSKLFPHKSLPHFVWIDENGIVKAITRSDEINTTNISSVLIDPKGFGLEQKIDAISDLDIQYPIFNHLDTSYMKFKGIFSRYQANIESQWFYGSLTPKNPNVRRVTIANLSPLWMYRFIYGRFGVNYGSSRQALEVKDPTKLKFLEGNGLDQQKWLEKYAFCYELKFKKEDENVAFSYAKKQLDTVFPQYLTRIEPRLTKCLVLIRSDSAKRIATNGGIPVKKISIIGANLRNISFSSFFKLLDWVYIQSPSMPLVDSSGVSGNVDLDIDAPLNDIGKLNQALDKYGLKFIEKECLIDILVIKDRI